MLKLIVKGKVEPREPSFLGDDSWTVITNQFSAALKWKRGGNYYGIWGWTPLWLLPVAILYMLDIYIVSLAYPLLKFKLSEVEDISFSFNWL